MNYFVRKSGAGKVIEALAAAMSQDQIVGINLLQCRNDLMNVIVVERWHDMEAADHRVHLRNPRSGLRLPYGVDDSAMAARGQHHESLVFQQEIRRNLVLEIVRDECAGILGRRDLLGKASETVHDADFPLDGRSGFSKLASGIFPVVKAWSATTAVPSASIRERSASRIA